MRIMATAIVVICGTLLLALAEVADSLAHLGGAGHLTRDVGLALTAVGLVLLVTELDPLPVRVLRDLVTGRTARPTDSGSVAN